MTSTEIGFGDFEQEVLPHLKCAHNLARWLARDKQDAEDLLQEAFLRAFRFYHLFRGGDARPWLLTIVRNTHYGRVGRKPANRFVAFDENLTVGDREFGASRFADPEEVLIQKNKGLLFRRALEALPSRSREILVLRGQEGMSYNEIAGVLGVPSGTVMSTLSRARSRLRESMADHANGKRGGVTRWRKPC